MDVLREMMTEGDELVQSVDNDIVIIGRMEDLHLLNEENLGPTDIRRWHVQVLA